MEGRPSRNRLVQVLLAGPVRGRFLLAAAGIRTSGKVTNGRGRPMACLMVLQMNESPGQRMSTIISRQSQPRLPPFQSSNIAMTASAGKKNGLPLANGMITSKTGLLNVSLMKRNTPTSTVWSQCTRIVYGRMKE